MVAWCEPFLPVRLVVRLAARRLAGRFVALRLVVRLRVDFLAVRFVARFFAAMTVYLSTIRFMQLVRQVRNCTS